MKDDGTFELQEKLSEDDHAHLRARWDVTALRRNAEYLGVNPATAAGAEFWSYEDYENALRDAADEAEAKEAEQEQQNADPAPGGSADPVGGSTSDRQAAGLTQPNPVPPGAQPLGSQGTAGVEVNENGVRAFADPSLAEKPYKDWTNEQLKAEVAKRNEMREGDADYADEEPMVLTGNKSELVDRLVEDDEADSE